MRRAFRTKSRVVTSPVPSRFGVLVSIRTTCSWRSWSSAASSMVTIRSPSGIRKDRRLSRVVFPEPVPPEMIMFRRAATQARRNSTIFSVIEPNSTSSLSPRRSLANLRMVIEGPSMATGGITALTREPSGRRASTVGESASTCLPKGKMILSINLRTWLSSAKIMFVLTSFPSRSI